MTAPESPHILVVDDELSMRELLELMLKRENYQVSLAKNGLTAIEMLEQNDFDLILCDIRLGDITGLEVLKAAKKKNRETVVVLISAYATTELAVEAMNEGAFDYVPKPFDNEELKQAIKNALKIKTGTRDQLAQKKKPDKSIHFGMLVGEDPKMLHIYELVQQTAKTKTSVMITGESGTGKELIANSLHKLSNRFDKPFVVINCGGIPDALMESELFGHKKGAFTGATHDKKGLFELADKGVVFLDEVGELSVPIQVKLLRAVQEKVFKPVGGTENIKVDIRIISATNKNLEDEVINGKFREDLFYRLNVIEIKVPPLRERKSDLRTLAQHFIEIFSKDMDKEVYKISSYAIDLLQKYDFPGNIRELRNLIERSVALTTTNIILPDSLTLSIHKKQWKSPSRDIDRPMFEIPPNGFSIDNILENIEREYIKKALEASGGNKNKTAELLGITLRSLRHRIGKLDITD